MLRGAELKKMSTERENSATKRNIERQKELEYMAAPTGAKIKE